MSPPAGWHPDPPNSMMQRWWDSVQWGPQTRPAFDAPPPPAPMQGVPYRTAGYPPPPTLGATGGTTTRLRKTNGLGFTGAVLGLGSFLINPFLLTSITALVFCILGLTRDEQRRREGAEVAGRGWIIAGLVLALASAALYGTILFRQLTDPNL